MQKKTIYFIALSGGVDSSVAAHLLLRQGIKPIGISHIVWPESKCCSTNLLDTCERFAKDLGLEYYKVDCLISFCKIVVDNFVDSYFVGQTPNPCVLCNEFIRFEEMVDKYFSSKKISKIPNYKIVTGHYAQTEFKKRKWFLKKGKDKSKDQSYMLYRLSQNQLAHVFFPLGKYLKTETRALAQELNLVFAKVKESQDACFVEGDYRKFIDEYSEKRLPQGFFVDKNGKVLGKHKGIQYYTRGQRKGLGVNNGPWFVISIEPKTNKIVLGKKEDLFIKEFYITKPNWIYQNLPKEFSCKVQTRYHAKEKSCIVQIINKNCAKVWFKRKHYELTPGQSAVFYDKNYVIGGGFITLGL